MTEKQRVKEALRQSAGGAEVITLSQISRFFGRKKPTTVDYRLTEGLEKIDGKWYLLNDVADAIAKRMA